MYYFGPSLLLLKLEKLFLSALFDFVCLLCYTLLYKTVYVS